VAPTRAEERALVRASLQQQVEERQTRLVAPHRLAGDLDDPRRQSELRIARIAAREFHQARLGATGRELFAGLDVDISTLRDPLARAGLVSVYAMLEVDGFVVHVEGAADGVEACAELVFALRLQSGKPVEPTFELDREHDAVRQAEARVLRRAASA
jgi:hypothetical protein